MKKTIADNDQDKSLHKKILSNKAGVLNWIIEGAKSVIDKEDIFISEECIKFKTKFIKETDSVALFLESSGYEKCSITKMRLSNLYSEYKDFCSEDGYRPLGKTNFSKRLTALGYDKVKAEGNNDFFLLKQVYIP